MLLVGEALSRQGLEPVIMELSRSPWVRGSMVLTQVRGKAFDLLRAFRPVGELNPARASEGFYLQSKALHLSPPVRMHQFLSRLAAPGGDPYLAVQTLNPGVGVDPSEADGAVGGSAMPGQLPRSGGNPVDLAGTAIFRGDRLGGYLNVDETQMLLALRGEMGKAYITFPDPMAPGRSVTLRYHQENLPKFKAYFVGRRPRVDVRLMFEGEVLAMPGGIDYVQPPARQRLEAAAARYAEQTLRAVLQRLVRRYGLFTGADRVKGGGR